MMSPDTSSQKHKFSKRYNILAIWVVLVIALVGWWNYEFPSATWRYKLTLSVETPEGIKTGSVVRETRAQLQIKAGESSGGSAGTAGEALILDLGERGVLFGLTEELDPVSYVIGGPPAATREGMKYYSHLHDAKADLLKENYQPRFVTFQNINDPLTVQLVDLRDLSKSFGSGVFVREFILETTDEPLTKGYINTYLPWLEGLKGGYLNGAHTGRNAPLGLHAGNFQKVF